jgi:hypothetical protein
MKWSHTVKVLYLCENFISETTERIWNRGVHCNVYSKSYRMNLQNTDLEDIWNRGVHCNVYSKSYRMNLF